MYDIAVIGGGPAGLSAAIQARARNKSVLVVSGDDRDNPLYKTSRIDNYLGFYNVTGPELLKRFRTHAGQMGVERRDGRVLNLLAVGGAYYLSIGSEVEQARAVVLATGVVRAKKYPGEAERLGAGVSYCATCDGMLYRGKPVAVVGYTDTARQEAELDHEIISSVSRLYFSIFRIDLKKNFYEEISSDNSVHRLTGHRGMAQQKLNELCSTFVDPEYRLAVRQFFDLSTVPDRLADTDTVGMDYLATNGNWYMARFIEKRRDEAGQVTHILYVTRNVTKEKRQELEHQKLKIAYQATEKANEAKTAFLLNMSHDIRTPMNAILGYAHLMRKELTDPKLLHYQEMIEESGSLLLSIINNVLDMAKIESGRLELNEDYNRVGDVVGKIVAVFQGEARKKNLTLTRVQKATKLDILCDVTKLQELFTNLISNAVKYTPPGGTVTVTTEELPCAQPGHVTLRTEVADTGIGISREFLPHLFEPFSRERNTTAGKVLGTGLGMPIVRSLVELMGGTITVESEQGKGSKFTVTLTHKLADQAHCEKKPAGTEEQTDHCFTGKRLLLAEDNDLNAEIATAFLQDMGFTVDRAVDGADCVDRYQHEAAGTYGLILMDIQMPNMDGYQATLAIRGLPDKEKAGIPIVAMTANAFAEDRQKAFNVGMNGHIAKPINTEILRETLRELL